MRPWTDLVCRAGKEEIGDLRWALEPDDPKGGRVRGRNAARRDLSRNLQIEHDVTAASRTATLACERHYGYQEWGSSMPIAAACAPRTALYGS
jgi:hypothetical protein